MMTGGWRSWGLGVGGVTLAVCLLALAWGRHAHSRRGASGPADGPADLPTRQQFEASVVGLTGTEVRQKLGEPEKVVTPLVSYVPDDPAEGGWRYPGVSRDSDAGSPDRAAWLWMRRGRVSHVTFDP
jgi:hypothetical protein